MIALIISVLFALLAIGAVGNAICGIISPEPKWPEKRQTRWQIAAQKRRDRKELEAHIFQAKVEEFIKSRGWNGPQGG